MKLWNLFGRNKKPDIQNGPAPVEELVEDQGLGWATLEKLQQQLTHHSSGSVWLGGYSISESVLDAEQKKIDELRRWAKELPDGQVRKEYLRWLEYYFEIGIADAREELRTRATEKRQNNFKLELSRSRKSADNLHSQIPTPPNLSVKRTD